MEQEFQLEKEGGEADKIQADTQFLESGLDDAYKFGASPMTIHPKRKFISLKSW